MTRSTTGWTGRPAALVALLGVLGLAGCAGHMSSKVGTFTMDRQEFQAAGRELHLMLVKPVRPRPSPCLVVFGSGDAGLMGISKSILQHLGDAGYYVAGYSAREAMAQLRGPGGMEDYAGVVAFHMSLNAQAKRALGLPETTPTIVAGMSRGANMVIVAAGDSTMRRGIVGAVAIALTREIDELKVPKSAGRARGIQHDENGKVRTYPAIRRLGSIPLAVIQSTNDKYVPSAESRRLIGPDTPTRRLYEVPSRNHSFSGGQDVLMRDLDDALLWIEAQR